MEGVFEVSFGPTFTSFRQARFRLYKRLHPAIGLRLDAWETNRLYRRLIAREQDLNERQSLENEHMFEQQACDERIAVYISDRMYAKARRLYIEIPSITGLHDDPNWERCQRVEYGRHFLTPKAVGELRTKIRAEIEARWKPIIRWGGWIVAGAAMLSKLF
jgi:hypothetical protein